MKIHLVFLCLISLTLSLPLNLLNLLTPLFLNPPLTLNPLSPFAVLDLVAKPLVSLGVSNNHYPGDYILTCQLAANKGYPCAEVNVTTLDGYILTVHRIPYGVKSPGNDQTSGKPVVFLQHGVLDASSIWVVNFPNKSLGFLLADAGYDVWMGNMRGNTYGKGHVNLTTADHAFWRFTFDEMAKYDLTAMVEFALETNGQPNLYYIGHSQGTEIGFVQFSQDPDWAKSKIKQFHALAPVAWLSHTTSLLRIIALLANELGFALLLLGQDEFLPNSLFMKWLASMICDPSMAILCENPFISFNGYEAKNMNGTRSTVYPGGTSTYNMIHFGQLVNSKKLQAMDWGYIDNEKIYGSPTPPEYHPNTMTVPTALYWGDKDTLADPTDVAYLQTQIQNLIGSYRYPDFDHADFVKGVNAPKEVYPQLMELIATDVGKAK